MYGQEKADQILSGTAPTDEVLSATPRILTLVANPDQMYRMSKAVEGVFRTYNPETDEYEESAKTRPEKLLNLFNYSPTPIEEVLGKVFEDSKKKAERSQAAQAATQAAQAGATPPPTGH